MHNVNVLSHSVARLPCPSLSPRVCSNSCPLSWWCHPTISPSVVPFSSCLKSFPASGSFPMSWLFESGGQFLIYVPLFAIPWTVRPPGSSVHGILQARILEWVAISFSRGSSQPRNRTWASCTAHRDTWECVFPPAGKRDKEFKCIRASDHSNMNT